MTYCTEIDCIIILKLCHSTFWKGFAGPYVTFTTKIVEIKSKFKARSLRKGIHYLDAFPDDFGSCSISRNDGNVIRFHKYSPVPFLQHLTQLKCHAEP